MNLHEWLDYLADNRTRLMRELRTMQPGENLDAYDDAREAIGKKINLLIDTERALAWVKPGEDYSAAREEMDRALL